MRIYVVRKKDSSNYSPLKAPLLENWFLSFCEKFCMCEDEKKLIFFKEFFKALYIFMLVIQLIHV